MESDTRPSGDNRRTEDPSQERIAGRRNLSPEEVAEPLQSAAQERLVTELAERVEELQAMLDIVPVPVWIARDPECRQIQGNAHADRIMQAPRKQNISASAPPGEAAVTYKVLRRGVEIAPAEMPAQRAAATGKPVLDDEIRLVFPDNRGVDLLLSAVPLVDREGKVRGMLSAGSDITELKRAQEEIRKSEERLRLAVSAGRLATWDRDLRTGETVWNDEHFRALGYEPGEVKPGYEAWAERVHPDDRQAIEAEYGRSLDRGGHYAAEFRLLWPDGSVRWAEARGRVEHDAEGRPLRSYGVMLDITERKRVEESLRRERSLLDSVMHTTDVMLVLLDAQFNFVWVNPAYANTCGMDAEAMVGKNHFTLYPNAENEAIFRRVRDTGQGVFYKDKPFLFPDQPGRGLTYWDWSLTPVKDAAGNVAQLVFSLRDMTKFKQAEAALETSESRFRLFMDNAPTVAWMKDEQGRYVYLSETSAQRFGTRQESVRGKTDAELWPAEIAAQLRKNDLAVLDVDCPVVVTEELANPDGSRSYWINSKFPFRDAAGKRYVGGIGLDITDRKQMEDALRTAKSVAEAADRAKSEFLANMSHEIRTPMNAVLGFTDLLLEDDSNETERREYLRTIQQNGKVLLQLINDILDLSRIEAERIDIQRSPCCPRILVDEVVELLRLRAKEKNLSLEAVYQRHLPPLVSTDPVRLRQILVNLVGNAVKFTEQGSVRVNVTCSDRDGPAPRLHFAVVDTGIGIPPHALPHVFEAFTQADASHSRRFGGSGLGLAISQRLAARLGGQIEVASEPGRGSCFTLSIGLGRDELPVDLQSATPAAAAVPASTAPAASRMHGRVLLAEDTAASKLLIRALLGKVGLEVEHVESGLAACAKAQESLAEGRPYDLILMDIQMPEMDGYAATRKLRREGWQGPIVALTAHAMAGDREKCLEAGCDDYLTKPVSRSALLEVVARYLAC